jgi:hypothetical protein
MELYIKIKDGQPFEHPIMGDNFREAFPDIDVNNLPAEFAKFERVECNVRPSAYEITQTEYQWVDGIVKDVWSLRQMTEEEKTAKIDLEMQRQLYPSWTFDEPSCKWVPPIPYPTDGGFYAWDEATLSWVTPPTQP